jgi:hypothetical protein
MGMNTEEWFEYILTKYEGDKDDKVLTVLFLLDEMKSLSYYTFEGSGPCVDYFHVQKLATEAIKIVDELYKKTCPTCGRGSMEDVRPGKRQCRYCG